MSFRSEAGGRLFVVRRAGGLAPSGVGSRWARFAGREANLSSRADCRLGVNCLCTPPSELLSAFALAFSMLSVMPEKSNVLGMMRVLDWESVFNAGLAAPDMTLSAFYS